MKAVVPIKVLIFLLISIIVVIGVLNIQLRENIDYGLAGSNFFIFSLTHRVAFLRWGILFL